MELSRRSALSLLGLPPLLELAGSGGPLRLSLPDLSDVEAAIGHLEHPFLMVDSAAFNEWPAKADVAGSVWEGMRSDAIHQSRSFGYTHREAGETWEHLTAPGVPIVTTSEQMRSASLVITTVATSALAAYLSDPPGRDSHLDVLERMLRHFALYVEPYLGLGPNLVPGTVGGWEAHVVPTSCFVNMLVVLDVAHADLVQRGTLETHEQVLHSASQWVWSDEAEVSFNWASGLYGARVAWSLYAKEYGRAAEAIADYIGYHRDSVEADGLYLAGPYYGTARHLPPQGQRENKQHVIDILEHLGLIDYGNDEQWQAFHEWLFAYANSPVIRRSPDGRTWRKDHYVFSDTGLTGRTFNEDFSNNIQAISASVFKAHRFGDEVYAYAGDAYGFAQQPAGRFWHFAFYDRPFPEPRVIPSKLFPSGNAVFRDPVEDPADAPDGLSASFWNASKRNEAGGHLRYDTNAIHLTAYGEHVLRGAGYPGYTPMINDPEYWLHNRSHNTVMVDGQAHVERIGAGFEGDQYGALEAVLGTSLDYATGDSGDALPNAVHKRSLIQVHSHPAAPGYWIVVDEVSTDSGDATVRALFHPSATTVQEVLAEQTYRARMDYLPAQEGSEVDLTIFFATEPESVAVDEGKFQAIGIPATTADFLRSEYPAVGGISRTVTVLVPSAPGVTEPSLERVSTTGATGARIAFDGQIVDHAWESAGLEEVDAGEVTFQGKAALYRQDEGQVTFALVRQGTSFHGPGGLGFQSPEPVTVLLEAQGLHVVTAADVDVWFHGVRASLLRPLLRDRQRVLRINRDSLHVRIPRGAHSWIWS